jgi:hypothetical protein
MGGGGCKKNIKSVCAVRVVVVADCDCDCAMRDVPMRRCLPPSRSSLLPIRQVASSTKSRVGSGHMCHTLFTPDFSERNRRGSSERRPSGLFEKQTRTLYPAGGPADLARAFFTRTRNSVARQRQYKLFVSHTPTVQVKSKR